MSVQHLIQTSYSSPAPSLSTNLEGSHLLVLFMPAQPSIKLIEILIDWTHYIIKISWRRLDMNFVL